jgi:hypothetical protein
VVNFIQNFRQIFFFIIWGYQIIDSYENWCDRGGGDIERRERERERERERRGMEIERKKRGRGIEK